MGLGASATRVSKMLYSQSFSGWRVGQIGGDSGGEKRYCEFQDLPEAVAFVRVLHLAYNRIAPRAQETANQAGRVVMVNRQTPTLDRLNLTTSATNTTLMSKNLIVLLNGQLVVV